MSSSLVTFNTAGQKQNNKSTLPPLQWYCSAYKFYIIYIKSTTACSQVFIEAKHSYLMSEMIDRISSSLYIYMYIILLEYAKLSNLQNCVCTTLICNNRHGFFKDCISHWALIIYAYIRKLTTGTTNQNYKNSLF